MKKKLTYEELEEKVKQLEKNADLVHYIQNENYENNQFLKILLDTIPSPIFYKDTNFIYQNCNNAFSEMILGIPKEKIITAIIQARLLRRDDYVFRLGGEEFGLLFYSNDEISALKLADSIRSDVQNTKIKQTCSNECNIECNKVTISMGLITIKYRFDDMNFIYDEADRLMYKAKQSGKNRVISKLV